MTEVLPRWDVTDVFPSPDSREYAAADEAVGASVARLGALFDQHGIGTVEPHAPTPDELVALEEVLAATNDVLDQLRVLGSYLLAFVSTDAGDDLAQGMLSRLQPHNAQLGALRARLSGWVGSLGADALIAGSVVAADHAWPLRRWEIAARHQMTDAEEGLAADLSTTGARAWGRLHSDLTSGITAELRLDGAGERVPVTVARALGNDPDPVRRRAGYDAEVEAYRANEVPIAAAMNAIKGEAITLNERRGIDALDVSLHLNGVDRVTLDAMTDAVVAALPDFRRWMRAKALLHGHAGGLPWWDLVAPLPVGGREYTWLDGTTTVERAFDAYGPALGDLARRALGERWVDAEPRAGKRGGAFCASLDDDRSLVLLNWSSSLDSTSTLAHELGHAYHNTQLAQRRPLQRQVPMALAETASIFCETLLVADAITGATSPAERLAILDVDLAGACQVVVDIHSRFLFEHDVFNVRRTRTLAPSELCDLMLDSQQQAYGDGIDLDTRHPYMWALKPHYYSTHFYNWPYTYGLLFGIGLYAEYQRDPERFRAGYDELLSLCGLASAAELAGRFGIDVQSGAFWSASLDVLRTRIGEYERLAASLAQQEVVGG
jgi:oligoendopeptidase F